MPNTITCSNGEVESQFHEVDTYEDWIAGCKANHPSGRLNKKGDPGHIAGYGEDDDQEWIVNKEDPDMQADILTHYWIPASQVEYITDPVYYVAFRAAVLESKCPFCEETFYGQAGAPRIENLTVQLEVDEVYFLINSGAPSDEVVAALVIAARKIQTLVAAFYKDLGVRFNRGPMADPVFPDPELLLRSMLSKDLGYNRV